MRKRFLIVVATFATLSMTAGSASAQSLGARGKCEAAKNQEVGKYIACLHKAEAAKIKMKGQCSETNSLACFRDDDCPGIETCTKDLTKWTDVVGKCHRKFANKWEKLTLQAAAKPDPCPDGLLAADVQAAIGTCTAKLATGLAGGGLEVALAGVEGTYRFGPGSSLTPFDEITGALDHDNAIDLENEEMTITVTPDGKLRLESNTVGAIEASPVIHEGAIFTQIPDQAYSGTVDELDDLGFPPVFSGVDPLLLEKKGDRFGLAREDKPWRSQYQTKAGRKYELQVRCCPRTS